MKKDLLKRLAESKSIFQNRQQKLLTKIDKDTMQIYSNAFDELKQILDNDEEPFEKAMLYVIRNIEIPFMDNVYYFFVERAFENNETLFDHQLDAWINRLTQNLYKATIPLMFKEQDGKVVRIAKDDVEAVVQGFFKNYEIAPRFIALSGGIVNNIMNGVVSKHKAFMSTPEGMEPSIPARVKIFWDKVNLDKDWYSHVLYETNFYDAEAINSDQENNGNVELTASLLETILRKMKGKKAEKLLLNVLPKLMSVTDKSKDLGERASELVTAWASKLDWLDAQSDQLAKGSTFDEVLLDNMQEGFEKKKLSVFIEVQKLKTQNIRNINWREFLDAKNAEELEKKFIQFNDDLMKLEFEHLFKKLYIDDLPALKALLGSWAESFQHYEGEAAYLLWSKGNFYDALSIMRGMVGDNASVTAKEIKEVADSLNKIYSDHVNAKKIQMREFERNDYMESRISQSIKREIYLLQCECDKKYGVESPEIVELRKRIQGLDALKIALDAPAQAPKEPIRERQTGLSKREHKAAPRAQSVTPSIEIRGGTSRQLQLREISDEIRESTKVIYLEPWMTQNLINQLRSHNNQSQGRQILWCFGENVFCYNVATHPENRKYSAVRDEDKSKGQASNIKDLSAEQANECCRGIVSIGGDIDTFSQIFHDSLDRVCRDVKNGAVLLVPCSYNSDGTRNIEIGTGIAANGRHISYYNNHKGLYAKMLSEAFERIANGTYTTAEELHNELTSKEKSHVPAAQPGRPAPAAQLGQPAQESDWSIARLLNVISFKVVVGAVGVGLIVGVAIYQPAVVRNIFKSCKSSLPNFLKEFLTDPEIGKGL